MSSKRLDLTKLIQEIKLIQEKYNLPRWMFFVPDKLEITLKRNRLGIYELNYSEFFEYNLPLNVFNIALQNVSQLIPRAKKITQFKNGATLQLNGDFRVVLRLIIELLFQKKMDATELRHFCSDIIELQRSLNSIGDTYWSWNDDTADKWDTMSTTYNEIVQDTPSVLAELQAVIKKYAAHIE